MRYGSVRINARLLWVEKEVRAGTQGQVDQGALEGTEDPAQLSAGEVELGREAPMVVRALRAHRVRMARKVR